MGKFERYQAEALVHQVLPTAGLVGIACCDAASVARATAQIAERGLDVPVAARPNWYF